MGRLVNGELNPPVAALNYLGHQSGVFGANVLVVECTSWVEAIDVLIKATQSSILPSSTLPTMWSIALRPTELKVRGL